MAAKIFNGIYRAAEKINLRNLKFKKMSYFKVTAKIRSKTKFNSCRNPNRLTAMYHENKFKINKYNKQVSFNSIQKLLLSF